jgi:hypothetical protein
MVFVPKEKDSSAAEGAWHKYKMARVGEFSADHRAVMRGAIHEKTFSANFSCGNIGDRGHVRSCRCDQTKSQRGVRNNLYRSQAQLSRRLFL